MEYRCPKCDAVLNNLSNKYVCGYCKSEYDIDYFSSEKKHEFIIPFEIDKNKAIEIYYQNIKSRLLVPSFFKKRENINKMEGLYIPCYIYNLDSTGEVEFDASKISKWKSKGIKYQKTDKYSLIRGGDMTIKDMLVVSTTSISNDLIDSTYDYSRQVKFEDSYIKGYRVCDSDMTKEKLLEAIKEKAQTIFTNQIRKDIKDYNELNDKNSLVNLYNPSRYFLLVPIWMLTLTYKGKNHTYIINGQTGYFNGKIPTNNKRLIFLWIFIFITIFTILLLLSILGVIYVK